MAVPASVMVASSILYIALSPALIMGWGPLASIGIAGAATASVASFTLGAWRCWVPLSRPEPCAARRCSGPSGSSRPFPRDLLAVGAPGSLNTLFTNLTVVRSKRRSSDPSDGAGSSRVYGLGGAARVSSYPDRVRPRLGASLPWSAPRRGRATARGTAGGMGGDRDGRCRSPAPSGSWLRCSRMPGSALFTTDSGRAGAAAQYLRVVGPVYGFFGRGLALYFASQGAGRLLWPLVATFARLIIAGMGGWLATRWLGGARTALFAAMAVALINVSA